MTHTHPIHAPTETIRPRISPARRAGLIALSLLAAALVLGAAPASAAAQAPRWQVSSSSLPTNFSSAQNATCTASQEPVPVNVTGATGLTWDRCDQYVIAVTNVGDGPTDGSNATITDTLPAGVTATNVQFYVPAFGPPNGSGNNSVGAFLCTTALPASVVTCNYPAGFGSFFGPLQPQQQLLYMIVDVSVDPGASGTATNSVMVSGGGAPDASGSSSNQLNGSPASFGVQGFDFSLVNRDGTPYAQAGGHPWALNTDMTFNSTTDSLGHPNPAENVKDTRVDLPPGLIGNPTATPRCLPQDFVQTNTVGTNCPADTQIGTITVIVSPAYNEGVEISDAFPVYNLVPPDNEPAQFGMLIGGVLVTIDSNVLPGGGYALSSTVNNVPTDEPVISSDLTLWGVPADPSHDPQRACPGQTLPSLGGPTCPTGAAPEPFLTNPTSCPGSPLSTGLSVDSWQNPGAFASASASGPATSGCDRLSFTPSITVRPDTSVADSPSGLSVDLKVPQNQDPSGLATPHLRKVVVTLPAGVSVNPSSANGRAACSPDQIGLSTGSEPTCPDSSKLGSVEVDTPLLPDPLKGSVYLAQQNNNPFVSLLAIYVTAEADGTVIKLAGHVVADPVTGQLTTTFENNPQLPFSDFKLDFFGGPRGALASPESCGTFTTTSDLEPWSAPYSGPDFTSSDPFTMDSGCVSGFSPSFTAGTQNPQAGAYSPFVLSFSRSDTDQHLSGLTVELPPGMVAKLAGVQECSDAQLAAAAANSGAGEQANPSCPAGSQVGTVTTAAGPGPDSVFLGGKAYLTGAYKGAPYGLAVIVPAVAGPYDLGTVVVRQALYIDPTTAQVTAVSDAFPTILQGIPLRLRRVEVTLNRPDFTLNPTSCDPMSVTGILSSTGGLGATFSPRFQVGGCQALGFSPKLKIALSGKGQTHSGNHPTLTATLTQGAGQANIRGAKVALPLSLALDPNNSQHVCNYDVAQAVHGGAVGCPASSIVGTASAVTPLLDQPLTGPVYLVQGIRFGPGGVRIRTLPSLLVPLRGQIALDLRASSSVNGASQLVTTFSTIPDAPVSKFTLQINGGHNGLLVITGRGRSICTKPQVANAGFGAQSGKASSQNDRMATPCGKAASAQHARRHKRHKKHK